MSASVKAVNDVLVKWYLGEVGGHALFTQLAVSANSDVADKWTTLAKVEELVRTRLSRVLTARGVTVPQAADVQVRAQERCAAIVRRTWIETMQWLRVIADKALQEMQADAKQLPPDLVATGDMVVRHEAALLSFAEIEMQGGNANSLFPIHRFLTEFQTRSSSSEL
jgi:hypothetical protein